MSDMRVLQQQLRHIEAHEQPPQHAFVRVEPDWQNLKPLGEVMDDCYEFAGLGAFPRMQNAPTTSKKGPSSAPTPPKRVAPPKRAAPPKKSPTRKKPKTKGPPPWSNAKKLREGDTKVAKALPASAKKAIDKLPLSSVQKKQLKGTPITFLINMAKKDPRGIASFIHAAKLAGSNVSSATGKENPAELAKKLVAAVSARPSMTMKAVARTAMSGYGGLGAVTAPSKTTLYVGLAPALVAIAPVVVPVLSAISANRAISTPSAKATADAGAVSKTTVPAMSDSVPPAIKAAAETEASSSNLKRNVLIGLGVLGAGLIGRSMLKRKK